MNEKQISRTIILARVAIPFVIIAVIRVPCVVVAWVAGWL